MQIAIYDKWGGGLYRTTANDLAKILPEMSVGFIAAEIATFGAVETDDFFIVPDNGNQTT